MSATFSKIMWLLIGHGRIEETTKFLVFSDTDDIINGDRSEYLCAKRIFAQNIKATDEISGVMIKIWFGINLQILFASCKNLQKIINLW